jgi:hypothetical protein
MNFSKGSLAVSCPFSNLESVEGSIERTVANSEAFSLISFRRNRNLFSRQSLLLAAEAYADDLVQLFDLGDRHIYLAALMVFVLWNTGDDDVIQAARVVLYG